MYFEDAEFRYVRQRMIVSRRMALAAAGSCARMVHETLAARYAAQLEMLPPMSGAAPAPKIGLPH